MAADWMFRAEVSEKGDKKGKGCTPKLVATDGVWTQWAENRGALDFLQKCVTTVKGSLISNKHSLRVEQWGAFGGRALV